MQKALLIVLFQFLLIHSLEVKLRPFERERAKLEEKMIAVEARYTKQYSALDALLSRLGTVSAALKSAIDGLVNSQKSN